MICKSVIKQNLNHAEYVQSIQLNPRIQNLPLTGLACEWKIPRMELYHLAEGSFPFVEATVNPRTNQ